jgi:hypothetical protein
MALALGKASLRFFFGCTLYGPPDIELNIALFGRFKSASGGQFHRRLQESALLWTNLLGFTQTNGSMQYLLTLTL